VAWLSENAAAFALSETNEKLLSLSGIPCIPSIAARGTEDGRLVVEALAERRASMHEGGTMPFRDAVSVAVLLGSEVVSESLLRRGEDAVLGLIDKTVDGLAAGRDSLEAAVFPGRYVDIPDMLAAERAACAAKILERNLPGAVVLPDETREKLADVASARAAWERNI